MSREPRYRYHVYLPGTAVDLLETIAASRGVDAQQLAGELLARSIAALVPPAAPRASGFVGPFPAEGEGWCRSGIPEDWKAR